MENISKTPPLSKRDIHYYRERHKTRLFAEIAAFFAEEAERRGATKGYIAARLGCDPSLITRWLSVPSNLTQEAVSDILLALDAELDFPIKRFSERALPNEMHPLIAGATGRLSAPLVRTENSNYTNQPQTRTGTQATAQTSALVLQDA